MHPWLSPSLSCRQPCRAPPAAALGGGGWGGGGVAPLPAPSGAPLPAQGRRRCPPPVPGHVPGPDCQPQCRAGPSAGGRRGGCPAPVPAPVPGNRPRRLAGPSAEGLTRTWGEAGPCWPGGRGRVHIGGAQRRAAHATRKGVTPSPPSPQIAAAWRSFPQAQHANPPPLSVCCMSVTPEPTA